MLGMETSKELVKMLLVLLQHTLFSESPPGYFTRAQCNQNFQLGQNGPGISQYPASITLLFSPFFLFTEETGYSCFHLKSCLGKYPFEVLQQEAQALAQGCDVIQVMWSIMKWWTEHILHCTKCCLVHWVHKASIWSGNLTQPYTDDLTLFSLFHFLCLYIYIH